MWQLQTRAGATLVSGSGPVAWSAARGGWETAATCYADPDRALVLVDLPAAVAAAVLRIDADVDAIYLAATGQRQTEYEEAERQARAYQGALYLGQAPPMVTCWATAKGWTNKQAADDILAQADIWRGAQQAIRAQRLASKEQARNAASLTAVASAMATWAAFVAATRAQLGLGAA